LPVGRDFFRPGALGRIKSEDGSMARLPELMEFRKFILKIVSVAD
jgi:3,4-dihydroxy 2-butanone 4-phosphate synthase/GTP cyclohydrolase II